VLWVLTCVAITTGAEVALPASPAPRTPPLALAQTIVYEDFNAVVVVMRTAAHAQWLLSNVATVSLFPHVRGLHGEQVRGGRGGG
jgi:hypothetical protein